MSFRQLPQPPRGAILLCHGTLPQLELRHGQTTRRRIHPAPNISPMKPSFKNGKFATSIYEKCLCQKNGISRHRRSVLISTCAHKASFRRISKYNPTRMITDSSMASTIHPYRNSDAGRLSMPPCWPSSRTADPCSRSSPLRWLRPARNQSPTSRPLPLPYHHRPASVTSERKPMPSAPPPCSTTSGHHQHHTLLRLVQRQPETTLHSSGRRHSHSIRNTIRSNHIRWNLNPQPNWTRTTTRTC